MDLPGCWGIILINRFCLLYRQRLSAPIDLVKEQRKSRKYQQPELEDAEEEDGNLGVTGDFSVDQNSRLNYSL